MQCRKVTQAAGVDGRARVMGEKGAGRPVRIATSSREMERAVAA